MRIPTRTHLEASIVGEGPPVLLVHGLGGNRGVWREVARLLRGDHAVLTLDLPGSGRSAPPLARDGCADFEALADSLAGVAEASGRARWTLVGHSMGGYLAALVAARHPTLARGLVLVDQGLKAGPPAPPGWRARFHADPQAYLEAFLSPTVTRPAAKDRILRDAARIVPQVFESYLGHMGREDLADREPLAGLPILACVRDAPWADTPEYQAWLCRQGFEGIRNLRVARFPTASHWLMWEEPARFAALLRAFESTLPG